MVYKFLSGLAHHCTHQLQQTCLLCHCNVSHCNLSHCNCKTNPPSGIFGLCRFCHESLPWIGHSCERCALPLLMDARHCGKCLTEPPLFSSAHCAASYEGSIPALIHQLKHRHNNAVTHLLTDIFGHSIKSPLPAADLLIPVPMHCRRNLKRGNNHSDLLGKAISKNLGIPFNNQLLQRIRPSPTQQGLTAEQRRKNLANAFVANKKLEGMRIAVLDDVLTTGSTMNEIAKTLRNAGAVEVHAWAVARTPRNG